jgi:hypothetical protein
MYEKKNSYKEKIIGTFGRFCKSLKLVQSRLWW